MLCSNCAKELVLDGEFYHSDVEFDGTSGVIGTVTVTFMCKECMHEFGEYNIELELDITNFTADHDDEENHELSVELDDESFDEHKDQNGVMCPGATATVRVGCSCGSEVNYVWSNYESTAVIMAELIS